MSRFKQVLTGSTLALALVAGLPGLAEANSFAHSGRASEHSAAASGHASAAVVTAGATVVAIPLIALGEVGKAAGEMGDTLWEKGTQPLPLTRETVTRETGMRAPAATRAPEPVEPPPAALVR